MSSSTSGPTLFTPTSEEEEQLHHGLMDQRKRKRMISNRESAKRSRMRKQKHLDGLITQLDQLGNENNQIISTINLTLQLYMNVEAENSVLRAQLVELETRLESLNEIIGYIDRESGIKKWVFEETGNDHLGDLQDCSFIMNNNLCFKNLPIIMESSDVF